MEKEVVVNSESDLFVALSLSLGSSPCGNAAPPPLEVPVLPPKPPPKLNAGRSLEGGAPPPKVLKALGLAKLLPLAAAAVPPPPEAPPVNKGLVNGPFPGARRFQICKKQWDRQHERCMSYRMRKFILNSTPRKLIDDVSFMI